MPFSTKKNQDTSEKWPAARLEKEKVQDRPRTSYVRKLQSIRMMKTRQRERGASVKLTDQAKNSLSIKINNNYNGAQSIKQKQSPYCYK